MKNTWGVVGFGNLAQAIFSAAIHKKLLKKTQIVVTGLNHKDLVRASRKLQIKNSFHWQSLPSRCEIAVFSTKPQDFLNAARGCSPFISNQNHIVSLAAGIDSIALKKLFPNAKSIVRVMANTPALVNAGCFGFYVVRGKPPKQIRNLFAGLGTVIDVYSDKQIDSITSAVSSGSGFVIYFMEQFVAWLKTKGFSKSAATQLVVDTFWGTGFLTRVDGRELSTLREQVTSKKGTTLAGLKTMGKRGVPQGLKSGLEAAFQRAKELSKELRLELD